MDISAELFGRKRTGRRSDPGKPRLPGAANPEMSFIPYYAFPCGIGTYEALFIHRPPCSPFPVPMNYSLGRNLVLVAVTRKRTKGLNLLRPASVEGVSIAVNEVRG